MCAVVAIYIEIKDYKMQRRNYLEIFLILVYYNYIKRKHLQNISQWLLAYCYSQLPGTMGLSNIGLGLYLDGDRISMSISVDSNLSLSFHLYTDF